MKNSLFRLTAILAFAWTLPAPAPAAESLSWKSPLLGRSISCTVRLPDSNSKRHPVVVYLKNLPSPRLGRLDDKTLIKNLLDQGMMVIEADYESDARATAPELLPEIDRWYTYLFETRKHPVDRDWIYIVPEGYAIDRKVNVCEIPGRPVEMDVLYPSGKSDPVPLMLQITSTKDPGKWINQRAYYIYGLLTAGYAGAIMDYNGGAKVSPKGEVFPEKRAARLLRAHAGKWNLSGRLGVTGHSKGSSRAAKAAFINDGERETDPGPHAGQSDRFQVALMSAGQHAKEFLIEDGFLNEVGQAKREAALRELKQESVEEKRLESACAYVTPDDPPVNNFWAVTLYDPQTRSQLQTSQPFPSVGSQTKGIKKNDDGSTDVFFGPKAPAGYENNWLETVPGKSWFVALRMYGPLKPWLDQTWRPSEIELAE